MSFAKEFRLSLIFTERWTLDTLFETRLWNVLKCFTYKPYVDEILLYRSSVFLNNFNSQFHDESSVQNLSSWSWEVFEKIRLNVRTTIACPASNCTDLSQNRRRHFSAQRNYKPGLQRYKLCFRSYPKVLTYFYDFNHFYTLGKSFVTLFRSKILCCCKN